MNNVHEQKLNAAAEAIDALFSDKTVDRSTTRTSLVELRDQIDGLLEALAEDDRAARKGEP